MRASLVLILFVVGCANPSDPGADLESAAYALASGEPLPPVPAARCVDPPADRDDCYLTGPQRAESRRKVTAAALAAGPLFADAARARRRDLERAARTDPDFFSRMSFSPSAADRQKARGSVARLLADRERLDLERLIRVLPALSDRELGLAEVSLGAMTGDELLDRALRGDRSFIAPLDSAAPP